MAEKVSGRAVSPKKLLSLYSAENGGFTVTRDLLAFHLREGNIRARAWHMWESDEHTLEQAWRNEPKQDIVQTKGKITKDYDVVRKRWWRSTNWILDKEHWQFNRNRFFVTLCDNPPRRLMLRGIRFHGGDVRACFDPKSSDKTKRAGRPRDAEQWRMFWHEVIRKIQGDRDDFGELGSTSNERFSNKIIETLKSDDDLDGSGKSLINGPEHKIGEGRLDEDVDIAHTMQSRLNFHLKFEAVHAEIKALRKAFRLSRGSRVKPNAATQIGRFDR